MLKQFHKTCIKAVNFFPLEFEINTWITFAAKLIPIL